jgi:preprotein translocase subunit SecA
MRSAFSRIFAGGDNGTQPTGTDAAVDIGPAETPTPKPVAARKDPVIVGAGRARSLNPANNPAANTDWSTVGRNDPCPCGSGKKFKKCHGASL